jgi:dihydroorotate dehydrogenase electron transfer subunit
VRGALTATRSLSPMQDDCHAHSDWLTAAPGMVGTAVQARGRVVDQTELAHHTYRLRVYCPPLAARIRPGQFFMVRFPGRSDPLLGRPFALYDVRLNGVGQPEAIEFVYHVIGKATGLLSQVAVGDDLEFWGPLGNGFPEPQAEHLICVGGGIGYTPFLAVAREAAGQRTYGNPRRRLAQLPRRTTLCYGVRSGEHRADLADFAGIPNFEARIATDDGSEGHHGFVTDLLAQTLDATRESPAVYCCGPEPMMHAVARLCAGRGVPCWLSLETPMACGFGACFSCVTKVKVDEAPGWDYRRTCIEGPIFDAAVLAID